MEVDPAVRTGDVPVQEIMEKETGSEPVPEEAGERTGGEPVLEEAVGEAGPAPVPEHPAETPSSAEPRKKRIKTLAG